MKQKLMIVRGLPGSGKSTLANNLKANSANMVHFEADMFFEASGEYKFKPSLLTTAHDWCYSNTAFNLLAGKDVVVSNTFTKMWEMEKYLAIGSELDCDIIIIEMKTQYGSIHGVPADKIVQMQNRWEEIPNEIKNSVEYHEVK